jgi:hypothetical protein
LIIASGYGTIREDDLLASQMQMKNGKWKMANGK